MSGSNASPGSTSSEQAPATRPRPLRSSWHLLVYCWRLAVRHRAEGMAAELTYRTIFSLIPVVVLGLVMFRVFGGLDDVQLRVENQLFSFFGVPEIPAEYLQAEDEMEIASSALSDVGTGDVRMGDGTLDEFTSKVSEEAANRDAAADEAETTLKAQASIRRVLHDVTSKIANLDFASIGVFGLILFVYAAVALADATENLFNVIFDAPTQRPIHIRVAIHWSIITLGSGLLALSLYMSGQVVDWVGTIGAGSRPLWFVQHALSLLAGWVLMFLLYALMPNTHVSVRAAAIGAGVAAVLWEVAKFGFQIYVTTAVPYSALYGSLGLIPLFLFWIYVTWIIVLFGLILTSTLQSMRGRILNGVFPGEQGLGTGGEYPGDPDWMLPIMTEVAIAFASGRTLGRQELADRLGLPSRLVHQLEGHLIQNDFLRRVSGAAGDDDLLTLARPAERISVPAILELAHQIRPTNGHPAWQTLADLKLAERAAASGRTLDELLPVMAP